MSDLIERLRREVVAANADNRNVTAVPVALLREAAAALEAAREDAWRVKRDIAELYDVMPMLPITAETLDAATDWFTRYCIDFHREINAAIDQARAMEQEAKA